MVGTHPMVVGIFRDHLQAQRCYEALRTRGYADADINILMSERTRDLHWTPASDAAARKFKPASGGDTMGLEGMGIGGAVGTAIGGSLAAIAAIGTSLVIPGLNVIVAGPLAAALAGGGAGALTGGLIGGLIGLGFPEESAEAYRAALQEGGTVLGVTLHDNDDADDVMKVFRVYEAEQVHAS